MILEYPKHMEIVLFEMSKIQEKTDLIRGNIYDVGMSFDIETTQIPDPEVHHAYMYIWQYAIDDLCIYGRTWEAFTTFYQQMVDIFKLGKEVPSKAKQKKRYKAICLVHNLAFEWQFIKTRLPWQVKKTNAGWVSNIFTKDAHNVITATTLHNLEFRCTLNLTDKSLNRLAKDYNLDTSKLVGSLDYNKQRNSITPLTYDELHYCFNDVLILTEFFKKVYSPLYLHGSGKLPTTKTSIIRNELGLHFSKLKKSKIAKYPKGFPKSEDAYKYLMNWVYRGGYVHSNAEYTAQDLDEPSDGYDFRSSYPTRILLDKMPYVFKKFRGSLDDIKKKYKTHAFMFTARFYHLQSTTTHSLESYHKCMEKYKVFVDNGRIAGTEKDGYITVALTELDYISYTKMYTWDKVEVIGDIFISKKEYLPTYLVDMVCKYYYQKSTIDKIADPIGYMLAKQNLNSLYGMCASSIFHDDYVFNGLDFQLSPVQREYSEMIKDAKLLPQWGVWISSYSRFELISILMSEADSDHPLNRDAIYGDTDSLKLRHPERYTKQMDLYNKKMDERLQKRDLSKLDFDFIGCKDEADLKSKIYGIGQFVREAHISRFKTLGCKRYIMVEHELLKDGTYDTQGHTIVKCAGMKSEKFLEKYSDKSMNDLFELFDFDLELSGSDSGKLAHAYNDFKHSDTIQDDYGNVEEMHENTSLCLFPIPFRMRDTGNYAAFFLELQEKLNRKY